MRLRVKPLRRKELGSGLVSLDRRTMDELAACDAAFVRIDGSDVSVVARPDLSRRFV